MTDPIFTGLLKAAADGDLNAVLMLSDHLEEHGDPRAEAVRRLHGLLYDDWMFAPLAFRHFEVTRETIRRLFPEFTNEPEA
jgi:hypothetical protein